MNMHAYDAYHSRWFIIYSFLFLAMSGLGWTLNGELADNVFITFVVILVFSLLVFGSAVRERGGGPISLITWVGFLSATASVFLESTGWRISTLALGMGLMTVTALLESPSDTPETGESSGEWLNGAILLHGFFSPHSVVRRTLLLCVILRGLAGLIFRLVPVRVPLTGNRRFWRGVSWWLAVIMIAVTSNHPILPGLVIASRLAVLIDEGWRRVRYLAGLVSPGARTGLFRTFLVYYRIPGRFARMRRFYRTMIRPGHPAWDVGAHLGNRCRVWLSLGAVVVAYEPQPDCARLLDNWFGTSSSFTLRRCAVGSASGMVELRIPDNHPTLASVSGDWVRRMSDHPLFNGIAWNRTVTVPMVSLMDEEVRFGRPVFVKIDVEGHELQVIKGLGSLPMSISFEILPADRENALDCIAHLEGRDDWTWNLAIGESFHMVFPQSVDYRRLVDFIRSMDDRDRSGDIYANRIERH